MLHRPFPRCCFAARNGDDELQIGDTVEIFGLQGGGGKTEGGTGTNGEKGGFGDDFLQILVMNVHDVQ